MVNSLTTRIAKFVKWSQPQVAGSSLCNEQPSLDQLAVEKFQKTHSNFVFTFWKNPEVIFDIYSSPRYIANYFFASETSRRSRDKLLCMGILGDGALMINFLPR